MSATWPHPVLSSKASTLESVASVLRAGRVLPLVHFTVGRWREARAGVLTAIAETTWGGGPLIVRSSSRAEDRDTQSLAGHFTSVRDVCGPAALGAAIDTVVASYGTLTSADDQVLVQPMLSGVVRSGVAFTADPATGAPYRVIEWIEGSDTTAVTSGRTARKYFQAKNGGVPAPALAGVVALLTELESLFPATPLDVEFAVTDEVYLLQVRPLVMYGSVLPVAQQSELLTEIAAKVREGMRPHPFLHGKRTIYGVMPDWNPAEIIGIRPRGMALSLYRELITDSIWAYQRNNYGYKNLRSHPLLRHFHGLPYIDVRVSFNSFVPRDIEDGLADRLVDHYLDRLQSQPELHDKVEFEIVYSCYSLDLPARLEQLKAAGFSDADCAQLAVSLRLLTNQIMNPKTGRWREDQARIKTLTDRRARLYAASSDPLSRIYWLLEDCKRYGTLPFAGLARAGFIAVQMLRSLVSAGVLSKADHDRFINSLGTISGQLPRDLVMLDRTSFLAHYGHLRPGTYDILSPRYDEAPDRYFDWSHKGEMPPEKEPFSLSLPQMRAIGSLLSDHALELDAIGLFDFLQAAIELRESSKFEFTRNLSDALSLMAHYGEQLGFSREDLSFANVNAFYELHAGALNPRAVLEQAIDHGKTRYAQTCSIVLPPLLMAEEDVWAFELPVTDPNFITQKRITAEVAARLDPSDLPGRIVCIPSADPGYDWLFSHRIAGLVTAYGGANSHMAIRANELALPAVIGAGEVNFRAWSHSRSLTLDCANHRVELHG